MRASRRIRIAACADYLLGVSLKRIEIKYHIPGTTVCYWVRKAGFKLRNKRATTEPTIVKLGYHQQNKGPT
jgi:uncharacterized protein YjcR